MLNAEFFLQMHISGEIFMKTLSGFPETGAKLWKNALSCTGEDHIKNFLNPDPHAGDIRNVMVSSLFKGTS